MSWCIPYVILLLSLCENKRKNFMIQRSIKVKFVRHIVFPYFYIKQSNINPFKFHTNKLIV